MSVSDTSRGRWRMGARVSLPAASTAFVVAALRFPRTAECPTPQRARRHSSPVEFLGPFEWATAAAGDKPRTGCQSGGAPRV